MPDLNFTDDYGSDLFSGQRLHDRLVREGKTELILKITGVRRQTFRDAENPEWVLSFGMNEDELRLKKQMGRLLATAFGPDGNAWVGKEIALSAEFINWKTKEGEAMEGYSIRVRPVSITRGAPPLKHHIDDEIPF